MISPATTGDVPLLAKPDDDTIRRRWTEIRRLNDRVGYRPNTRLRRAIAGALADRLEGEGVTEADLDRLGLS